MTNQDVYIDIATGAGIIIIGAIIYVGRHLYKKRRRIKDLEGPIMEMEELEAEPPKKTAADHLEEIKEVTQKVLQPLKSSVTSSKNNSARSSSSFGRTGSRYDSLKNSLIMKLQRKPPPPPPPSPLRSHCDDDDIKVNPTRISLLNVLLTEKFKNQLKASRTLSRAESRSHSTDPSGASSKATSPRANSPGANSSTFLQTLQQSESSVRSRKDTNDYTNFQPIQNIKPTQSTFLTSQPEDYYEIIPEEKAHDTAKKQFIRETQDDEVILYAPLDEELVQYPY